MSGYDIVPPNQNFRGMSYGEWAGEWCNWLLGSKKPDYQRYSRGNPVLFLRGAYDYYIEGGNRNPGGSPHSDRTGDRKNRDYRRDCYLFPS